MRLQRSFDCLLVEETTDEISYCCELQETNARLRIIEGSAERSIPVERNPGAYLFLFAPYSGFPLRPDASPRLSLLFLYLLHY